MTASALTDPTAARGNVQLRWEWTPCLLCGSDRSSTVIQAPDIHAGDAGPQFTVVRCDRCGLCFTNPRPDLPSMVRFYPSHYAPHQRIGLAPSRHRRARWWAGMPAWLRNRCPEHRGIPLRGGGRLLDVGCGGGAFLHRSYLQGWHVRGLDASQLVIQRIRTELGLSAVAGTLPHPELEPESFDVVTMWMSLEHMHQPRHVLEEVSRLLAPGGQILVAVDNIQSAPFAWFGTSWSCLDLPRHLTHFSPATLKTILRQVGFQVTATRMLRRSGWVRASARLAFRRGQARGWQRLLRYRWPSRLAASCCVLTGRSDGMLITGTKPPALDL